LAISRPSREGPHDAVVISHRHLFSIDVAQEVRLKMVCVERWESAQGKSKSSSDAPALAGGDFQAVPALPLRRRLLKSIDCQV
jgi:hypothetical protein